MPELPEVETVTRALAPLVGRRILGAEFRCARVLRGGDADAMASRLRGRRIAGVKRYGKFIAISLEGGDYLLIHLGMTGRLLLNGSPAKHTHAIFTLDSGALLYDDSRQFGCIQVSEEFPERIRKLGPSRSRSLSKPSPARSAGAGHGSRRCCSISVFCAGWATSMRTKRCSAPASIRWLWHPACAASGPAGCTTPSGRS